DYFARKGGGKYRQDTRSTLAFIVKNDIAGQCSWRGSGGQKQAFHDLKNIMGLLLAASKAKYDEATETTVNDITKKWLSSFVDRE
ncbi:hypothetical protein HPB47_013901, partial [Ixodes persulcatus]